MDNIRNAYTIIYEGKRRVKPHSQQYRDFGEKWQAIDILYQMADKKITEVEKIYQLYLADYYQFLTYLIEKSDMEDEEEKFQDSLRKAKKGRK